MLILGIDPGIAQTGYGALESHNHRYRPLSYGVITTSKDEPIEHRIHQIANNISQLIEKHHIEAVAIEDIFFARNVSSAIGVAKVIGAIVHQALMQKIEVRIFTPLEIKMAVTGYGVAEKRQVQEMVRLLLKLEKIPTPSHAADSLAAAICFATSNVGNQHLRLR